jgi:structural maintenance of chromosome 4
MFELAERLVGIYKVNHMTKSVTVENREYGVVPGAEKKAGKGNGVVARVAR